MGYLKTVGNPFLHRSQDEDDSLSSPPSSSLLPSQSGHHTLCPVPFDSFSLFLRPPSRAAKNQRPRSCSLGSNRTATKKGPITRKIALETTKDTQTRPKKDQSEALDRYVL